MTTILELLGLGFLVGTFGTLIGAGGGFILVPVLLLLYPSMKPELVTSISLAIVFLNASSGSIAYARMKRIDFKSGIAFGLATIPGAIGGALLTGMIPRHLFNLSLGVVLILISIFLFFRPQEGAFRKKISKGGVTRRLIDAKGHVYEYSFNMKTGLLISFIVGFLSSLLGIGGGIIHVPALTSLLQFPTHVATATSHFVLAIMALAGTIVHLVKGTLQEGIRTAIYLGIGVIIGAQLGAYLSHKIKATTIIRALAVALLLVGVRLLFGS